MPSTTAVTTVQNLYWGILGRQAEGTAGTTTTAGTGGLGYWAGQYDSLIASGNSATAAANSIATSISGSGEAKAFVTPVYQLYTSLLGRAPDAAGLVYWEGQLRAGQTVTQVTQSFLSSSEFTTANAGLAGATLNSIVISNAYSQGLARSADTAGYTYWTNQVANGSMTLAQVVAAIETSPEALSGTSAAGIRSTAFLTTLGITVNAANATTAATSTAAINAAAITAATNAANGQSNNPISSTTFTLTQNVDQPTGNAWTAFNAYPITTNNGVVVNTLNSGDTLNGTNATLNVIMASVSVFGATPTTTGVTTLVVQDYGLGTAGVPTVGVTDMINGANMAGVTTISDNGSTSAGFGITNLATAVTTLNVTGSTSGHNVYLGFQNTALSGTADAITVNLSGDNGVGVPVLAISPTSGTNGYETVTLNSTGSVTNLVGSLITSAAFVAGAGTATTLNVTGTAALTVTSVETGLTTINAGGSGSGATAVAAFSGNLTIGSGATPFTPSATATVSITGGSGNDTVFLADTSMYTRTTVNLGANTSTGVDKLVVVGTTGFGTAPTISGVETLELYGAAGATSGVFGANNPTYNLTSTTGLLTLQLDGSSASVNTGLVTVSGLTMASTGLAINDVGNGTNAAQTFDPLTLGVSNNAAITITTSNLNGTSIGSFNQTIGTFTTAGVTNLTINASNQGAAGTLVLNGIVDPALSSLTITDPGALAIASAGIIFSGTAIQDTINLSGVGGGVTNTGAPGGTAVTFTGALGGAALNVTLGAGTNKIVLVSSGTGNILNDAAGTGTTAQLLTGSVNSDTITGSTSSPNTIDGGTGINTINLGTGHTGAGTIIETTVAVAANRDIINGFSTSLDKVTLGAALTTVGTAAGTAPVFTLDTTAAANGGAARALTGATTNTTDIVVLQSGTTLGANGNLSAATDGTELLKALSANTTAFIALTTSTASDLTYLLAYQGGNAYLYAASDANASTSFTAAEIQLVAQFNGVAAGTLAQGNFNLA